MLDMWGGMWGDMWIDMCIAMCIAVCIAPAQASVYTCVKTCVGTCVKTYVQTHVWISVWTCVDHVHAMALIVYTQVCTHVYTNVYTQVPAIALLILKKLISKRLFATSVIRRWPSTLVYKKKVHVRMSDVALGLALGSHDHIAHVYTSNRALMGTLHRTFHRTFHGTFHRTGIEQAMNAHIGDQALARFLTVRHRLGIPCRVWRYSFA